MRRLLLVSVAIAALSLQGSTTGAGKPPRGVVRQSAERHAQRYAASAMVLQTRTDGPILCVGGVLASSIPAGCGGAPIANWRWDQVPGERTAGGHTWGYYYVVGTWNGGAFTVLQAADARSHPPPPPPPPPPSDREPEISIPCPRPPGGWPLPDPARTSPAALSATYDAAAAQPDFAGFWRARRDATGHKVAKSSREFVLVVSFTGELRRHEAALRTHWGGRLCLTRHQRTRKRLAQIQDELNGAVGKRLGLRVLATWVHDAHNFLGVEVVVADARARAALARRYGEGAVRVRTRLTPVP
jgi:hypothetical protein